MKRNRVLDVLAAGVIAGVFVACSSAATDAVSRMMADAGDAGDAAARHVRTDAGKLLKDASAVLNDASRATTADASAQTCASCAASGAVRSMTADTDSAQVESGYEPVDSATDGQWRERVKGPFMLTHVVPAESSISGEVEVGYAAAGQCETKLVKLAQVATYAGSGVGMAIQGARLLVPSGKVLCVRGNGQLDFNWSGFRPYN